MAKLTHLRPADYRRMRWKNGAGWTTELAVQPGAGEEFEWRISIAEIEVDGDFSRFEKVDRSILVLAGAGMELAIAGQESIELKADGPALAFKGEAPVRCRLLAGPTRDFNVMTRRGYYAHTLERYALSGSIDLAGECFVHVLVGSAQVEALVMAAGDSLQLSPAPGDGPVIVRGAAELVLARLRRVDRKRA